MTIIGSLKDWQCTDRLHLVDVPVLVLNGSDDESQDNCMVQFFDHLRRVKWFTFDNSAHFIHVEFAEKFVQIVSDFLLAADV